MDKKPLKVILLEYYQYPKMIWYDSNRLGRILLYKFKNLLDPPPMPKSDESEREYYDRIDPRFGIRYFKMIIYTTQHYDVRLAMDLINENYSRKRDREWLKKLVETVNALDEQNMENFKRYIIKSQILKNS